MAILKFKNKKWHSLYGKEFKNRLRKDKNLADIPDKLEARKNLELLGDVNDHHHDNHYNPRFERLEANIKEFKDSLNTIVDDKARELELINKASIDRELLKIQSFVNDYEELEKRVHTLTDRLDALESRMNKLFDLQGRLTFPDGNKFWLSE